MLIVTFAWATSRATPDRNEVSPARELDPLQTARVTIPFPWNEGEPVEIVLLTSTGLTFDYGIEVATATPGITARALSRFAITHADAIESVDVNPFVVLPEGQGATALDALVIARNSAARREP